jgi:hypothetical protein
MKAIVQDRFGPPEVLRLADTDLPQVGADDVLVRVHAAGALDRRRAGHRLHHGGLHRREDAV